MTTTSPQLSLDYREGTISGPRGTLRLEPKVMEVLVVLARYSGHVVSRNDLLKAVWPDVVVTEHTLSRCIYQLREALRDVSVGRQEKAFEAIETLPRRGYRLILPVEQAPEEIRVVGDKLFIELRRPQLLIGGLVLFVVVVAIIIAVLD
ncbi:MAG: winged helix-turn-helix domain-containing protein [Woeseiaceae bacterium]|nr:winged helix-turn-helix domain-containing protein [Woeseiaceae bacterium]